MLQWKIRLPLLLAIVGVIAAVAGGFEFNWFHYGWR